jgi:hypothetical protein
VSTVANVASRNTVSVALYGSKVSDNVGVDFQAFGANAGIAGTHNRVTIELHGVSKLIAIPKPQGTSDTNTVTVVR